VGNVRIFVAALVKTIAFAVLGLAPRSAARFVLAIRQTFHWSTR
jgi:hypothetical protein